jgi:N utilization substance protein B
MCYQWDLNPLGLADPVVIERFWKEQALATDDNRAFFEYLVKGVSAYWPSIDRNIEAVLKNWKMSRIEKVDLAVLRVAVFELIYDESAECPDVAVVIDEAVEISKKFGNQGSAQFVNGVLDAISKADAGVA